jgi:hypothetical protein
MYKNFLTLAWLLLGAWLLAGCQEESSIKGSDDLTALQSIVNLDLPITAIRWEVFATPEDGDGIPGPTDYITLIAEIKPTSPDRGFNRPSTEGVSIAPNAVRPWLSSASRAFLAKHGNSQISLTTGRNCYPLEAKLVKTGKVVKGFACKNSGKLLVYLTLFSFTEHLS